MNTVTVPAVMHSLGYEADQAEATSVGAEVRQSYFKLTGQLPIKTLARKSHGTGTRACAVYPSEFIPAIEAVIRRRQCMRSMQRDLFIDGGGDA